MGVGRMAKARGYGVPYFLVTCRIDFKECPNVTTVLRGSDLADHFIL